MENERLQIEIDKQEQRKVSTTVFKGEKEISILQNDLTAAAHSRGGWNDLLKVQVASLNTTGEPNNKSIVFNYNILTSKEITAYLVHRQQWASPKNKRSARNMYNALYDSLSARVHTRIHSLSKVINYDGPTAVYHLLKMYRGSAQATIRNCLEKISTISLEAYHYNVDDFVAAVEIIWGTLKNSGGSDDNDAQKIYEVLSRSKSDEFNTQL